MSDKGINKLLEQNNEKIFAYLKGEFKQDVLQAIDDNGRIVTDLLRQEIKATENRMTARIDRVDAGIDAVKTEIIDSFHDVVDFGISPQIDGLDHRVSRLERRPAM
jgi:hypothetical protein